MESQGLDVTMGPFGSIVEGDTASVATAIGSMVRSAIDDGAVRVLVEVTTTS
jgi:uncharacterized protein YqgV (UPF0045/DUF77 family)